MLFAFASLLLSLSIVTAVCPGATPGGPALLNGFEAISSADQEVAKLAAMAGQSFFMNSTRPLACKQHGRTLWITGSPAVISACSQVVAGTNYDITFRQSTRCGGQAPSAIVLEAMIFEPLPIAGNSGIVVQSVRELT